MNSSRESLRPILKRLNAGRYSEAAILLARRLERDPGDEVAWHLLSSAVDDRARQVYCLERALEINPRNRAAAERLAELSGAAAPAGDGEPAADEEGEEEEEAEPHAAQPRPPPRAEARGPQGGPPLAASGPWSRSPLAPGGSVAAAAPALPRPREIPSPWQQLGAWAGTWGQRFQAGWRAFSTSPLGVLGLVLILGFGLMAVAHPILMGTVWPQAIYDPVAGYDGRVLDHPSLPGPGHLLGTDALGRDVLSRLLAAAAPTLALGLAAALGTALAGTVLGLAAACVGRAVDAVIVHMADVLLLLPAPILLIIVGVRFDDLGPVPLGLVYGLWTGAGATALVLRAHALRVMSWPYVESVAVAGGSAWHILFRHLLPAMVPLVALQMMVAIPGAVVADGFLSFLGRARLASNWGTTVYDALAYRGIGGIDRIWHMLLPAAVSLSLFALASYLVSCGLRRVISAHLPGPAAALPPH
jgi:peptide/nickel transport system permease protein